MERVSQTGPQGLGLCLAGGQLQGAIKPVWGGANHMDTWLPACKQHHSEHAVAAPFQ